MAQTADQQTLELQIRGLFTSPNNLSGIPQGALDIADNLVINAKNLAESRKGQRQYGTPLPVGVSGQVNKLFNYSSSLIANYADKMAYDSGLGVWVTYSGSYNAPGGDYKMRSLEALRNFYFNTDRGIFKIDQLAGTPKEAGAPKALGGTGTLTGTVGFLEDDTAVAYRMVWGYFDANNNLILGAPSQRVVVLNESGQSADVELNFIVPQEITTAYFYQIYRSNAVTPASAEPSDELQLVIQNTITSGEITAKEFTVVDNTPYSLMRATLYTSPSQEGIANANYQPPFAYDMDTFKGCAFYANVKQKQSLSLALISVDSPSLGYVSRPGNTHNGTAVIDGLLTTASVVIQDLTYTAVAAGIPGNDVSITYLDGGTAGAEVVTVLGSAITVLMQSGVSTATQIKTAYDLVPAAVALATVAVSGTGSNPQVDQIETFLDGGFDTSVIRVGMRVLGTGIGANALVLSVDSPDAVTLTVNSTASATVTIEFQDRFTIGGVNYWAGSTQNPATNTFLVFNSSTPGINIDRTAINLVEIINTSTTNTVLYAYYISALGDLPGQMLFEERSIGGVAFSATSTAGGSFSPPLPTLGTTVLSDNNARQNRVYISKDGQVEAVPLYRFFDVGSANFPIQRVVALRDGIFFFKTDGIYRLSGETFENFSVSLVDNTVILKVPESAVPFNNQVFCFTTQGVVAVTDSGVSIMSVPIESTLLQLSSDLYPNFSSASFGVAYESERLYMFFTVSDEADEFATQAYVYNSLTDSWTRWVMNRTCGVVSSAVDKIFMAQTDTGQVMVERKNFTNADYADEQYDVVVASVDSLTQLTLVDATVVQPGMTIVQGVRSPIVLDVVGDVITVTSTMGFTAAAAIVYQPIENKLQWSPIDGENPGVLKQYSEITMLFKNAAFRSIEVGFASNISTSTVAFPIISRGIGGWGTFPWGDQPWGGLIGGQNAIRTYVPREKQRCSWLTLYLRTNQAFVGFSLQGVSLQYNVMSSRFR